MKQTLFLTIISVLHFTKYAKNLVGLIQCYWFYIKQIIALVLRSLISLLSYFHLLSWKLSSSRYSKDRSPSIQRAKDLPNEFPTPIPDHRPRGSKPSEVDTNLPAMLTFICKIFSLAPPSPGQQARKGVREGRKIVAKGSILKKIWLTVGGCRRRRRQRRIISCEREITMTKPKLPALESASEP